MNGTLANQWHQDEHTFHYFDCWILKKPWTCVLLMTPQNPQDTDQSAEAEEEMSNGGMNAQSCMKDSTPGRLVKVLHTSPTCPVWFIIVVLQGRKC